VSSCNAFAEGIQALITIRYTLSTDLQDLINSAGYTDHDVR
jgi:hypothetical protein